MIAYFKVFTNDTFFIFKREVFSLASNLFFPQKFRSFFFQSLELQCLRFDIWTSLFKKWFDLKIRIKILVCARSLNPKNTYAKISKDADWHLLEQLHFLIWSICLTISSLPGHLKYMWNYQQLSRYLWGQFSWNSCRLDFFWKNFKKVLHQRDFVGQVAVTFDRLP